MRSCRPRLVWSGNPAAPSLEHPSPSFLSLLSPPGTTTYTNSTTITCYCRRHHLPFCCCCLSITLSTTGNPLQQPSPLAIVPTSLPTTVGLIISLLPLPSPLLTTTSRPSHHYLLPASTLTSLCRHLSHFPLDIATSKAKVILFLGLMFPSPLQPAHRHYPCRTGRGQNSLV